MDSAARAIYLPAVILDEILAARQAALPELRSATPELNARARAMDPPRGFRASLVAGDRLAIIGEFKRRSPSHGEWVAAGPPGGAARMHAAGAAPHTPAGVARTYAAGGAVAISVLTDRRWFGGSPADLEAAHEACALPVLRKDFIVDTVQVLESRAMGADAVLLIARVLEGGRLATLLQGVAELGMDALVEVHSAPELDRALEAGATIIGVNARDLATLQVDLGGAMELLARVPPAITAVAESGIRSREDGERAAAAGADALLVGGWLMEGDAAERLATLTDIRRIRNGDRPSAADVGDRPSPADAGGQWTTARGGAAK